MSTITPRIQTCLWFDDQAEQAARHYVSIFERSKIGRITRYGAEGLEVTGKPEGSVMTVELELDGHRFTALNGGPQFRFNEAMSIVVNCATQDEVEHYWSRLSEGGEEGPCGWLKDRFGMSWQVVPTVLPQLLTSPDREKAGRVMQVMMGMSKLDIAALQAAAV